MFQHIFGIVELFGVIGLILNVKHIKNYCLNHAWTKQNTVQKAWTFAFGYAVVAIVLFWLAFVMSNSIYLLFYGATHSSGIVTFGLGFLLAFVVIHLLIGGFFLARWAGKLLAWNAARKSGTTTAAPKTDATPKK